MSREWKPGDVAMVTAYNKSEPYRAYFDGKTWRQCDGNAFCVDQPTSHRPLVVIDLEDRDQIERLLIGYWDANKLNGAIDRAELVDNMQAALRSLVADPKPEEPQGLGAVVEDERGEKWLRHDHALVRRWLNTADCEVRYRSYDEITAVRVLSAGWSE